VTEPAWRSPRGGARVGNANGLPRSCESSFQFACYGDVFNYCQLSVAASHVDGILSLDIYGRFAVPVLTSFFVFMTISFVC
jgi:hypothetical protein